MLPRWQIMVLPKHSIGRMIKQLNEIENRNNMLKGQVKFKSDQAGRKTRLATMHN